MTLSASSAFDMYSSKPFCMHCLGDVDFYKGTVCGFCDAVVYCSESCHLADAGDHLTLCSGMSTERAKVTRVFDSIFHRDATDTTKEALENEPISERIKTCNIVTVILSLTSIKVHLASDTVDMYSACSEESYQVASRRFDYFADHRDLCLDFCVADLGGASSSSSLATRKMQRDAVTRFHSSLVQRKQVYLFHAKFPAAMLCLPRGQWLNRLDIELRCSECFSYISMALLQTAGIPWFNKPLEDVWILLRERTSVLPCVPCLLLLPLRDSSCD